MLHEGSSFIASFVEHPLCSNFKMCSVLILVVLLWFTTFNRKCICKSNLFLKLQVLRERSSFIASFVEHPVCGNFKISSVLIQVFLFELTTINPKCICKSRLFLNFQVLREGSSFVSSFVEQPVCSNFKMYSILILIFFILVCCK